MGDQQITPDNKVVVGCTGWGAFHPVQCFWQAYVNEEDVDKVFNDHLVKDHGFVQDIGNG